MSKKILIVEDDPFIAMDLQDTFEDAGYVVLGPVAAVAPGMSLLEHVEPDVAMLDYNLGKETSIPLARSLDIKKIPYVFLSGQVDRVVTEDFTSYRKVIPKPFDPQKLVSHISSLVETRM